MTSKSQVELKAEVYDVLVQIEQHQRAVQALQQQVAGLNQQIQKLVQADQEQNDKPQTPSPG